MSAAQSIYDKIDALSSCRTLPDLIAALQPILSSMAYYSVSSDGAILESHEEWHDTFTGRLYEALGKDRKKAHQAAAPGGRSDISAPRGARGHLLRSEDPPSPDGGGARAASQAGASALETGGRAAGAKKQCKGRRAPKPAKGAPMPTRPPPAAIPASLRAIMDGTHPSLTEKDDGS